MLLTRGSCPSRDLEPPRVQKDTQEARKGLPSRPLSP